MGIQQKASEFLRLHTAGELLQVVNVWDVATARVVADVPGTKALATAGHSIGATFGYQDNERIPLDLMLDMLGAIAACTTLPVSADLNGGYGNPSETVRKAIGVGIVGGNIEDRLKSLPDSVKAVKDVVAAGEAEGVDFVLNAGTDLFLKGGDRSLDDIITEAIERGRAYLDAGASCYFVPGKLSGDTISRLVDALGKRTISVIGVPGSLTPTRLHELGVASVSYGPWTQRAALTTLATLAGDLYSGQTLPEGIRPLN